MINSRKLEDLLPQIANRARIHIESCAQNGVDLCVTSTLRDFEAQHAIFMRGRSFIDGRWIITDKELVVTNADSGQSFHEFGCAYDVVPLVNGKALWKTHNSAGVLVPEWQLTVDCGKFAGLEWAGDWHSFKEEAHFQFTNGLTLAQLRTGEVIKT